MKKALMCMFLVLGIGCTSGDPEPTPTPSPTASVSPSASASPEPTETAQVEIYLKTANTMDCAEVTPVMREVTGQPELKSALEKLVAGPNDAERAQGLGGWFSDATKDMLVSASIEGDTGKVDFKDLRQVIPNASTSCGSATLLAQLDSTVKEWGVTRTLYSLNGSATDFYEWLQMGVPES